jgi:hypothetical protein
MRDREGPAFQPLSKPSDVSSSLFSIWNASPQEEVPLCRWEAQQHLLAPARGIASKTLSSLQSCSNTRGQLTPAAIMYQASSPGKVQPKASVNLGRGFLVSPHALLSTRVAQPLWLPTLVTNGHRRSSAFQRQLPRPTASGFNSRRCQCVA